MPLYDQPEKARGENSTLETELSALTLMIVKSLENKTYIE